MFETELKISRIGFPPFSARGCQQILMPAVRGEFRRTINGKLIDLGRKTHHKFKSMISCEDKTIFASGLLWVGAELEVSCIQRLCQEISGQENVINLLRPAVAETIEATNYAQAAIPYKVLTATSLEAQLEREDKGFISYCPILNMRLTNFSVNTQEWKGQSSWLLELEEI